MMAAWPCLSSRNARNAAASRSTSANSRSWSTAARADSSATLGTSLRCRTPHTSTSSAALDAPVSATTLPPAGTGSRAEATRAMNSRTDLETSNSSEETDNFAVLVQVDLVIRRVAGQPRHGHDFPRDGAQKTGAGIRAHLAHHHREARRAAFQRGVVRERILRLGHADRQPVQAKLGVEPDLALCLGQVLDAVRTVHGRGDRGDLVLDRRLQRIE